jgi:inhibitor of KinA sporulation pathway (predicted exonuclease)
MAGALKYLNIELEGTHHRGKDDARNIAKILWQTLE